MNRFVGEVARDAAAHQLLADGQSVLVAVSGGVDSVVLLEVLHRLSRRHRWRLVVGHFNHRLRGRRSDTDERFVGALAARLGWPLVAGQAAVAELARSRRISIEMAAREARHAFLASAARECRADAVALAHQADDQAELFLLRLIRGAGSAGLGGMGWATPSPADPRLRLVRPLLGRTRDEILAFAQDWSLSFRHDASNDCVDMLRNRIRKELIPLLERRYQPAVRGVLVRQAELLGAEGEFLAAEAAAWRSRRRPAFVELPRALQRRVLLDQLIERGVVPDFEMVEALRGRAGAVVRISGGRALLRHEGVLFELAGEETIGVGKTERKAGKTRKVRERNRHSGGEPAGTRPVVVSLAGSSGRVEFGGYRVLWRIRKGRAPDISKRRPGREWFDADEVGRRIELRTWRAGDRYQPLGLPKAARLQNLFVNARIPRELRGRRLLAADAGGRIWWVDGLRIAESCKVGPQTRRFLEWKWELK